MTLYSIFHWQNEDSTSDLNTRFSALFTKGVITGGEISIVPDTLEIKVSPFTLQTAKGLLVFSDAEETVAVHANMDQIIALQTIVPLGEDPTIELVSITEAEWSLNKDTYTVFSKVYAGSIEAEIISYTPSSETVSGRDLQDRKGRSYFRGYLGDESLLPRTDTRFNYVGDFYIVNSEYGYLNLWAWSYIDTSWDWVNITKTLEIENIFNLHKTNQIVDEKHLTDYQLLAAQGSYGSPGNEPATPFPENRYVTQNDPRVPTQNENDALAGATGILGIPSLDNKFITEEYYLTEPTTFLSTEAFVDKATYLVSNLNGAHGLGVFVGTGLVGSANKYFMFLDPTVERGYVNASGYPAQVTGVYKNEALTLPLNPSVDALDGYYTGEYIYITTSNPVNSANRLVYGRKVYLKYLDKSFSVAVSPNNEYAAGYLLSAISNIKGTSFDTWLSEDEQNVNLKISQDSIKAYLDTAFNTNIVAENEDFEKLSKDPKLSDYFTKNIGIDDVYTFENTGKIGFTYSFTSGKITYDAGVDLSLVEIGNWFRDAAGRFLQVIAVNDLANTIDVVDPVTGIKPRVIAETVGGVNTIDGSIKLNNNPRNILLSELKLSYADEYVRTKSIQRIPNEFSFIDGRVGYGLVESSGRFDPRVVFYGAWQSSNVGIFCDATSNCSLTVTDFFTDLVLLVKKEITNPDLYVSINGLDENIVPVFYDNVCNNVSIEQGVAFQQIVLSSGLSIDHANTITMRVNPDAGKNLEIYGISMIRSVDESIALLESGRAFEYAGLVKKDTLSDVSIEAMSFIQGGSGGRFLYEVYEGGYSVAKGYLEDTDNIPDTPAGVAGTPFPEDVTITDGVDKLLLYNINDLIYVIGAGSIEIRKVVNIVDNILTLDSAVPIGPIILRHICNLNSSMVYPTEEEENPYVISENFINDSTLDIGSVLANAHVISTDMITTISSTDIKYNTDGFGFNSSTLRMNVLATRLDVLFNNLTPSIPINASVSIDGSDFYLLPLGSISLQKINIFANAKYQSHEVIILLPTEVYIKELYVYSPKIPDTESTRTVVADMSRIARYYPWDMDFAGAAFPIGSVFKNAFHYMTFLDSVPGNDDWSVDDTFSNFVGRIVSSDVLDASVEFYFLGTAFEVQYFMGNDYGRFTLEVDGFDLSTFPNVVGNYSGGYVDAYSVIPDRKNIGAYGLDYGYHKVKANVLGLKQLGSLNELVSFSGYFICNENGYMSFGLNADQVYSAVSDTREFTP